MLLSGRMHDRMTARRTWRIDYGHVALNFVNIKSKRLKPIQQETFSQIDDVLKWLRVQGLLSVRAYRHWSRHFRSSSADARQVYRKTVSLREALYRIFWTLAHGRKPRTADVSLFNRFLAITGGPSALAVEPGPRIRLIVRRQTNPVAVLLGAIVTASADLLTAQDLRRLHRCSNTECGSLYFDRSRNRRRQWCHMRVCGSITKMRRYRRRLRSAGLEGRSATPRGTTAHPDSAL